MGLKWPNLGVRHTLVFLGFLGLVNVYSMRVNLSVAIVYMVNNTAINATSSEEDGQEDGPFAWTELDQGVILGMFFWGYVVSQVPGGRLAELVGGKWLFGTGVLVTAILTLLTPLAASTSVYLLYAVRIIEGLAGAHQCYGQHLGLRCSDGGGEDHRGSQ